MGLFHEQAQWKRLITNHPLLSTCILQPSLSFFLFAQRLANRANKHNLCVKYVLSQQATQTAFLLCLQCASQCSDCLLFKWRMSDKNQYSSNASRWTDVDGPQSWFCVTENIESRRHHCFLDVLSNILSSPYQRRHYGIVMKYQCCFYFMHMEWWAWMSFAP